MSPKAVAIGAGLLLAVVAGVAVLAVRIVEPSPSIEGGIPANAILGVSGCALVSLDAETGQHTEVIAAARGCERLGSVRSGAVGDRLVYSTSNSRQRPPLREGDTFDEVHVVDRASRTIVLRFACGEDCVHVDLSADGGSVAYAWWNRETGGGGGVGLIDVDTAEAELVETPATPMHPRFSPDGSRILIAVEGGRGARDFVGGLYSWEAGGNGLELLYSDPQRSIHGASWHPSGQRVVFTTTAADNELGVWVMDADGSSARQIASAPNQIGPQLAEWSPDGSMISYARRYERDAGTAAEAWVVGADGGEARMVYEACCNAVVLSMVWSPDGTHLAITVVQGSGASLNDFEPPATFIVAADGSGESRLADDIIVMDWPGR